MTPMRWMRDGARAAVVAMSAAVVLAGASCPGPKPPPNNPPIERKWPGKTGDVNHVIVGLAGTGRSGFMVSVMTFQIDPSGLRPKSVVEDGSIAFRLYEADEMGQPILGRPLGEWSFSEEEWRKYWSPGGWAGHSRFAFGLTWQGKAPPPGLPLILVTQFTPHGRAAVPQHYCAFTVQPPAAGRG